MSISAAMSNAVLGLRAAGRGAEVVSSNISNALTPGYGRRILDLSSAPLGGVRVTGVTRAVNAGLVADTRLASAANGHATLKSNFFATVESVLGTPDNPSSLSARMANLEAAFVTAASRPDAPDRLASAVSQAKDLAAGLQAASRGIQDARSTADRTISAHVQELNIALQQVETLNQDITRTAALGNDTSGLQDQRQQVVDRIGELVPVRELSRDGGQVALYTTSGGALIDGTAATLGFTPVHQVTPYLTEAAGTLSGLTINGDPVRTDSAKGALSGGEIAAQFEIRDELGIAAQVEIDALARDLVERFQDPAVDPTLGVTDAGLFTDEGAAFDPLNEIGISDRLQVNAAVDPEQGGEVWRLRDGLNAVTEGPVGEASLLNALTTALTGPRITASGSYAGQSQSASGLISTAISGVAVERNGADQQLSYTAARFTELNQLKLADGVDTDAELQNLLQVEQAYAANAKMIEVLDELMQILNRL